MTGYRPLREVPELAHLAVLRASLAALDAALVAEHPTIDEIEPRTPCTLRRARRLREAIAALRSEIAGYRRAVLAVLSPRRGGRPARLVSPRTT